MAATTVLDSGKKDFFFHCAHNPDDFPAKRRVFNEVWAARGLSFEWQFFFADLFGVWPHLANFATLRDF